MMIVVIVRLNTRIRCDIGHLSNSDNINNNVNYSTDDRNNWNPITIKRNEQYSGSKAITVITLMVYISDNEK